MEIDRLNKSAQFRCSSLVQTIQCSSDEAEVNSAKSYLYQNLFEDFYDRCFLSVSKLYGNFPDWQEYTDDVFQETFIVGFEIIRKFKWEKTWTENQFRNKFLYWMAEIANHRILNHINQKLKEEEQNKKYISFLASQSNSGNIGKRKYIPTYDKMKFTLLWQKLNNMTKEILLICAEHETLGENNKNHLPDEAIQYLKNKYNVSSDAIRKAKERGKKLLMECKIE